MPDNQINVKLNVADVRTGAADFARALQTTSGITIDFAQKLEVLNKAGNTTRIVLRGITEAGQEVNATLQRVLKSQNDAATIAGKLTSRLQQLETAQKSVKRAQDALIAGSTLGSFTQNVDPSKFNAVQAAVLGIQQAVRNGKVSLQEFLDLLRQANTTKVLTNISPGQAGILGQLRTVLGGGIQQQAAQIKADIADVTAKLRGLVPNNIPTSALKSVEAAIARIQQLMATGKLTAQQFNDLLAQTKSTKGPITNFSAAAGGGPLGPGGIAGLTALRTVLQQTEQTGVKAANSLFLTFQAFTHLVERFVIGRALSEIGNQFQQSVITAKNYSIKIAEIQTISQKAGVSTDEWRKGITDLSNKFGAPQTDVAEAAYQAISNQVVAGANSFKFLDDVLKFSQATVSSAADSVNLLSSALVSYNLPASEAGRVSAILFKTIEVGRLRASDIANSFGHLSILGAQAGVKLEELSAAIATLTVQGVKPAEALTLVSNILLKLINPTSEMKELLAEWGVNTGEAAIATFGFAGVLQRLDTEAQKGGSRIADLLGQIRAIRGVLGLTGSSFGKFSDSLGAIAGGQEEFENAAKLVAQSAGKQFEIELNKIKSFFTDEFGKAFIETVLNATKSFSNFLNLITGTQSKFDGLASIITGLGTGLRLTATVAVSVLVPAFAVTTIGALSASGAVEKLIIDFAALRAASLAFAATPLGVALLAGTLAAGATIAFSGADTSKVTSDEQFKKLVESGRERNEEQLKLDKKLNETTQKTFDEQFKTVLNYTAKVSQFSGQLSSKQASDLKLIQEEVKITGKTYTDSLGQAINKLNEKSTEAKNNILSGLKSIEDVAKGVQATVFSIRLNFANEGKTAPGGSIIESQALEVIQNRIRNLTEEAKNLFRTGTTESVSRARELFGEVEKLQVDAFNRQTELKKRQFEKDAKSGLLFPNALDVDGKPRFEFTVKTREVETQINDLAKQRIGLEEQFARKQAQRQKQLDAEAVKEKERLRLTNELIEQVSKFSTTDDQGKVKKEFTGKDGGKKAQAEFEVLVDRLNKVAGPQAISGQFAFFQNLYKQKAQIALQVEQGIRKELIETTRQSLINNKKETEQKTNTAKGAIEKGKIETVTAIEQTENVLKIMEGIISNIGKKTPSEQSAFSGIGSNVFEKDISRFIPVQKELQDLFTKTSKARDDFALDQSIEKAERYKQLLLNIATLLEASLKTRFNTKDLNTVTDKGLPAKPGEFTAANRIRQFQAQAETISQGISRQQQGAFQLQVLAQDAITLQLEIQKIPPSLRLIGEQAFNSGQVVEQSFRGIDAEVFQSVRALDLFIQKLQQAGSIQIIPLAPTVPVQREQHGGLIRYMAAGGFVPRGRDTVPAMLEPGEFVMNRRSSQKFYTQLVAMNAGIRPKYYSQGGPVTFGDINVSVSGSDTTHGTIRNIATGLRREIRRGNIGPIQ